jgi:flagellar biogenesis protein FliO
LRAEAVPYKYVQAQDSIPYFAFLALIVLIAVIVVVLLWLILRRILSRKKDNSQKFVSAKSFSQELLFIHNLTIRESGDSVQSNCG